MKTSLCLSLLLVLSLPAAAQVGHNPGDPVIDDPPGDPTGTATSGPIAGFYVETTSETSLRVSWLDAMSTLGVPFPSYNLRVLAMADIINPDDPASAANDIDNAQWTDDAVVVANVPVPQGDGELIELDFEDLDRNAGYVFRIEATCQQSASSDERQSLAQGSTVIPPPPAPKAANDAGEQSCGGSAAAHAGLVAALGLILMGAKRT